MRRKEILKHTGLIQSIRPEKITVKILSVSACAGCHSQSTCSMAEVKEKYIDITNYGNQEFVEGEQVTVLCAEDIGFIALWWAYIFPFITVLTTLLICTALKIKELYSGLISLGILIPYYGILSLFNLRFKNKFSFSIEKHKQN